MTATDLDGAVVTGSRIRLVLRFVTLGFMAAIVLVTYLAIAWTLRRGFDWSDEAFVDTMIASNRMATGEAWGFHHLLHPLYILTGESVLAFRIVRVAGYALLSVALIWCARFVARRMGIEISAFGWTFILLFAQAGTFLAWSYPPRYLGYNELASWFVQLGVALILLSVVWGVSAQRDRVASRSLWAIWAGLGAVTTLLVFAKVTSGLAFGAFLAISLLVPNSSLRLWKRVVSLAVGSASVLLALWVCGAPIGFYLRNTYSLLFDKSVRDAFGHPTSAMLSTYPDSLFSTGRVLLPAALVFALAMATILKKRPEGNRFGARTADGIAWTLGALLVILLFALPRVTTWTYLGELVVFIGAAGFIGLTTLTVSSGSSGSCRARHGSPMSRSLSIAVAGTAVLAAPFISSLGTNNPLTGQFLFAATLWAVVLGIALVLLAQRAALLRSGARSLPLLVGCVVMLMAALSVRADIAKPYRTAPLLTQQTSTSVPELAGMMLTGTEAAWVDWVSASGDSLRADGVPAIAINSRVPGAVSGALYAFNHSGYANPWLGRNWPAAFNSLRAVCTADPPSDLFVLQPGTSTGHDASTTDVIRTLASCGITFPGDFRVVARRASADPALAITVWRLRS